MKYHTFLLIALLCPFGFLEAGKTGSKGIKVNNIQKGIHVKYNRKNKHRYIPSTDPLGRLVERCATWFTWICCCERRKNHQ